MTQKQPPEAPPAIADDLARIERQMERGSLFTHTELSKSAERLHEDETLLYGLVDLLVEKGILTEEELGRAAARVRQEMTGKRDHPGPGIALTVSSSGSSPASMTTVNCAERIHICEAACCRMHFALTADEVQAGRIKWDHGQPYYIRQESNGYCSHLGPGGKRCSIYDHRPGVCQRYSCATDSRIWKDFDNMVLNQEWIDEHLGESKPRLVAVQMVPQRIMSSDPGPASTE